MSHIDRSEERVQLEPVTCWPLILGTAGAVVLGLVVLLAIVQVSVAFTNASSRGHPGEKSPTANATVDPAEGSRPLPPPPVAFRPERQVIVKHIVEPDFYAPLPGPTTRAQPNQPLEGKRTLSTGNPLRNCAACHAPRMEHHERVHSAVLTSGDPFPTVWDDLNRRRELRREEGLRRPDLSATHPINTAKRCPRTQP